ncbi:MAG: hypothetical protein B655_2039, partial [Methanobacterium sp. Maddingley MBC34]
KLNFDIKLKAVTLVTLIPLILYFAFSKTTPDLLVLTVLIFYLNFLLDPKYVNSSRMGLLAGFCGGVAFLAKSYVFFFFLVHFIIVNIDYWLKFQKNRKNITKNFVLGLVVFLCISGIWVAVISEKYDKFTIGTAGTYNFAAFGPESSGHPVLSDGLMKPWDKYALSVWDDPSYLKVKSWSPFSSIKNFDYEIKIILYDMLEIFKVIESFSVLSILIIFLAFFLIFKSSSDSSKNKLTLILLTIFIYSAGYCLIFVVDRYLWFVDVLLLLLGVFSVKVFSEEYSINKNVSMLLVFLVSFSFIFYPVFNLYDISGNSEGTYNLAENLKEYGVQGSNIAAGQGYWRDALMLSYYLDTKYYGLTKPLSSEKEISEELHSNNIEYYILWSNESMDIQGYEKLKDLNFDYPKIYRLSSG